MDNPKDSGTQESIAASVRVDHARGDAHAVDVPLRASVIFALRVYNNHILEGALTQHIAMAMTARNVGQIRRIIAAADSLLRN